MKKIIESISFLKRKISKSPEVGLILGSGLGDLADQIENPIKFKYEDIPGFPVSTVEGHLGQLVFGKLSGKEVVAMQGRFHFYEGYDIKEITFPIRVLIGLGIKSLFVTNAAGGVDKSYNPGDLMIIKDHINITGQNPLIGKNYDEFGPRFLDMSNPYDKEYINIARQEAEKLSLNIKEGNYIWFTGPTYETPAEVNAARILGANAVGMSTVPEVIVANHQGVRVLGVSCITNMAAGILDQPLNHEDVVKTSQKVKKEFQELIINTLHQI